MYFVYSTSIIPYLFNLFLKEGYFRSTFDIFYWWWLDFNIYKSTVMHIHSQENINNNYIYVRFLLDCHGFFYDRSSKGLRCETWSCQDMTVPSEASEVTLQVFPLWPSFPQSPIMDVSVNQNLFWESGRVGCHLDYLLIA